MTKWERSLRSFGRRLLGRIQGLAELPLPGTQKKMKREKNEGKEEEEREERGRSRWNLRVGQTLPFLSSKSLIRPLFSLAACDKHAFDPL